MVEIIVEAVHRVNFASAQNDVPVIKSLAIENTSDETLENLEVNLKCAPSVIEPKSWSIDKIDSETEHPLTDTLLPLSNEKLAGLNESEVAEIKISVKSNSATIAEKKLRLELLAKNQWGGLADMDKLLCAYVLPNDSAIPPLLKEASRLLKRKGHDSSIEGYQSKDPRRVWMLANAIYSAVAGMGLTYANPPASFASEGQKVRSPTQINQERLASCLDTSLLLAAAWEQAGLNPVILFGERHAWAGVWLLEKDFGDVTEYDVVTIRKAIQAKEFVPVETTLLTKSIGFKEAYNEGCARLKEEREHEFQVAIDIRRARAMRIKPLADHKSPPAKVDEKSKDIIEPPTLEDAPDDIFSQPEDQSEDEAKTPKDRIEKWQRNLLDLTRRNRLLNFKETKQVVPCKTPDIVQLVKDLEGGRKFTFYPLNEEDAINDRQLSPSQRDDIISDIISKAYDRKQITASLNQHDMNKQILTVYRGAKSDLLEGGTNTLFLAVGFLRWQLENEDKSYRAPLILMPVKIERSSIRSDFQISLHEDDIRFNSTLVEFLKRDFALDLPDFENHLSSEESGIDLSIIFQKMRQSVHDVTGFEVVEDIAISRFSFAKYLMWKDLVDRTDDLRNNRLVKHLVDNPHEIYESGHGESIQPHELDNLIDPKNFILPLPADSSQLAAVAAAKDGRDFILIGPPGTGKSQTIANIICQCIADGKTVLFVAEKMAALDVVYRRLNSCGLSSAVLELHSNKTDRKKVLHQLGQAWERASASGEEEWIEVNKKLKLNRNQLNAYVEDLHARGKQGFSIFEAVGWASSKSQGIKLEYQTIEAHNEKSFKNLQQEVEELALAHSLICENPPLTLVKHRDWSHEWQSNFLNLVEKLKDSTSQLIEASKSVSDCLGLPESLDYSRHQIFQKIAKRASADAKDISKVPNLPHNDLRSAVDKLSENLSQLSKLNEELIATYEEENANRVPV